jgi:hypothetical protein
VNHYYHNISHITFKNNVFVHGWAWGLCVEDIPYITALNNDFIDIAYHGIGLSGASHDGIVRNNIFYNIETSYWYQDTSSIDGDYNLIYNAQAPTKLGAHDQLGVDPRFVDPSADDYHLQPTSTAIDAGWMTPLVSRDFDQFHRPQIKGWDIGAFEYRQPLILSGSPGNQIISLSWQVNITLTASTTWQIDYSPANGGQPSPVTGIANPVRAFILDGLSNYTLYSVTLTAVDHGNPLYTSMVKVMPSDHLVIFPVVVNAYPLSDLDPLVR